MKKRYFIIILIFGLVGIDFSYQYLFINITPSMPEGIYLKSDGNIKKGSIVSLCLSRSIQELGIKRRYLPVGYECHGSDAVIKEVTAVPGDNVELTNNYIKVNNFIYPYKTLLFDSKNRPLAIFPRGLYSHTRGYWVIGNHAKNSWDSRYWGPIQSNQILYILKPLITW